MPLIADKRDEFGIKEFCKVCKKCVKTCPGKAISEGDIELIDGILKWQIKQESCYAVWRKVGTDCGVCLSACPFSQSIPIELVNNMKNDKTIIDKILIEHEKKNGIRPYIKQPLNLLE